MKYLKFTQLTVFLLGLFFTTNLKASEIIFTGPSCVTEGEIVEYQLSADVGWQCASVVGFSIGAVGGEILSVTNTNGDVGEIGSTGMIWASNARLFGDDFPLIISIQIGNVLGCRNIFIDLDARGWFCGSDVEFFPVLVEPEFGNPNSIYDISIEPLNSTQTIETCSVVEICLNNDDCTNIEQWTINNTVFATTQACIDYTVTSCPINVEVQYTNNCSNTTISLEESFQCDNVETPDLDFPLNVCLGDTWSLEVPGSIINVNALSTGQGNTVNVTQNTVWFEATQIGTVVFQLTYEICGTTYSRFIVISVIGCDYITTKDDTELSIESRSSMSNYIPEINVFPNPASQEVNFDFSTTGGIPEVVSIFDSSSRLVLEFSPSDIKESIDISNLNEGMYFVRVNYLNLNPVTKKLVISRQ